MNLGIFTRRSFLGHHLSVASIFIFPFFACLDYAHARHQKNPLLYFGIAALGLIALFLTYSRTLWVALPIGIFIWVLLNLPRGWNKRALLLPLTAGFLLVICTLTQIPFIQKRFTDRIGILPREALWLAQIEFFKARPITGVGWRHNQELSGYYLMEQAQKTDVFSGHAHNNFLDVLGSLGLIGIVTWLAWCVGVICVFVPQWVTQWRPSPATQCRT